MKMNIPLHPQSFNQESINPSIRNHGIRESPNQLINQSRRHPLRTAGKQRQEPFKFRLLPGEWQSNPKTQATRGGGLTAFASGIDRISVVCSLANLEGFRASSGFGLSAIIELLQS
jgi:hypothetical protein